jgi:hypothetical protein
MLNTSFHHLFLVPFKSQTNIITDVNITNLITETQNHVQTPTCGNSLRSNRSSGSAALVGSVAAREVICMTTILVTAH